MRHIDTDFAAIIRFSFGGEFFQFVRKQEQLVFYFLFGFVRNKMDTVEVLDVIDEMLENRIVPYVIYGMEMPCHTHVVFLDVDEFLRYLQFFEVFALDIFILVHPFE